MDAVLRLQRGAGNQAVARVLARRVKKSKGTGMRDDAAIARYVRKAVIFWRNNPTAGLFTSRTSSARPRTPSSAGSACRT